LLKANKLNFFLLNINKTLSDKDLNQNQIRSIEGYHSVVEIGTPCT